MTCLRLRAVWSFRRSLAASGLARSILATTLVGALYVGSILPARSDVIGQAQVIDGDTIRVSGERVRLYGIDAPESGQSCTLSGVGWPCGQNAARMLTSVTNGQVVTCKGNRRDRYGRLIAVCYVGVDDLNARMVRDGWALAYRRYGSDYVPQEVQARSAGSGIWQGQFVEPWEWRRQSRDSN
jgi:endonuclease YncB( thermonuclease family)